MCSFNHLLANHQSKCQDWHLGTLWIWSICNRDYHKNGLDRPWDPSVYNKDYEAYPQVKDHINPPRLKLQNS